MTGESDDVEVSTADHIATVRLCRPPNNFFSVAMIEALAATLESLDADELDQRWQRAKAEASTPEAQR